MIKRLFKRYIYACVAEQLKDIVSDIDNIVVRLTHAHLDKYITDVNDLKSDYLKRYLEVRMNNNDLSIQRLSQLADAQKEEIEGLQARIDILENK